MYEDGAFFFIEMNTRLQVEHPVTEMTTGIDIVQQQLRMARGEVLELRQQDVQLNGHSLECRINAEDPITFMPTPGLIQRWEVPGGFGVRVDSHVTTGYWVPPYYDSMVAKVITHGATRDEAMARMRLALSELVVEGISTNVPLHRDILDDPAFCAGGVDIHHLERWLQQRSTT